MKKILIISILMLIHIFAVTDARGSWSLFKIPAVTFGGSTGYYRASLENYTKIYDNRWDNYYSGQISVRLYRTNYITLQYARFQKTTEINDNSLTEEAEWRETFINIGLRWYGETRKRWRYYAGFGFTFINVKEQAGFSLLDPNNPNDVSTNGSGFFLEIGGDYIVFPHVALNLEFEASSAGEGGTPGFEGSSLGGYAFLVGMNFHF